MILQTMINQIPGINPDNIIQASNGKEAVERCLEHDFDLIMMDLNMPVIDGFKATKKIR